MESIVEESHPNLVTGNNLDSGECNQLHTISVKKPSVGIDQVQGSLEENI